MLGEYLALPDVALGVLGEDTVLVVVSYEVAVEVAFRVTVVLVVGTKAVVLIHHVVHLQLRRPTLPDALRLLRVVALDVIRTYKISQFMLLHRLIVTIAPCPQRGGNVEPARAVVHIQVVRQCVAVLVNATQIVLE